jgi:hypothetical protein
VGARTFVPLRFISEAFGAEVTWVESSQTVAIVTRPRPAEAGPLTLSPATGALQETRLGRGEPLTATGEGIYFLDLATGTVEGYAIPSAQPYEAGYSASANGRFVIARTLDTGYILDRTTGQLHKWDRYQYDLVVAGSSRLLFQEVQPIPEGYATAIDSTDGRLGGYLKGKGRYLVMNSDLQQVAEFTLEYGNGQPTTGAEAIFSPQESQVMISRDDRSYIVDLASGRAAPLAIGARFQSAKGGTEVVAFHEAPESKLVRRYDWQGKVLAESQIKAGSIKVSGDGEWIAWDVFRDNFTPVVYYARLGQAERPFQALGATICLGSGGSSGNRWLAQGGSASLLVAANGGIRVLGTDGSVATPEVGRWPYFDGEVAPGSEGVYGFRKAESTGQSVGAVSADGKALASVTILGQAGYTPDRWSQLWGATANEMRFVLRQQLGHDGPCGDYSIPLPLKLSLPGTFDATLALQVKGTRTCLNVRENPWLEATVVDCLQEGSRIPLGNQVTLGLPSFHYNDDGLWFKLPQGWILISSGLVDFAP